MFGPYVPLERVSPVLRSSCISVTRISELRSRFRRRPRRWWAPFEERSNWCYPSGLNETEDSLGSGLAV
jgi:hypothetical protein